MEEDILDAFLSYAVFHDDELEAPDTKPRKQSRRPSKKSKTAQPQHDDDDSFAKATCEAMLQGAGKLADAMPGALSVREQRRWSWKATMGAPVSTETLNLAMTAATTLSTLTLRTGPAATTTCRSVYSPQRR
jgi:hypothetical protein